MKQPLALSTWTDEEVDAAVRVLRSGHTTMGAEVAAFEQEFADYIGTRYAVMVNSGSSANLLMVAAYTLRHGPGTVIAPALSWPTSYNPFAQHRWSFVFVDIDDSLCLDPAQVQQVYRPGDVILACNILGNPCDVDRFPDAPILEDNCESLGASYAGRLTGTFGVMASHSFFFSHHLSTMEGGMITTNDRAYYELLRCLRAHGWTRDLPAENVLGASVGPFSFHVPGYNVRPMEVQAAIGRVQLRKLNGFLAVRRDNAARCPFPHQREVGESSWFGFAVAQTPAIEAAYETRPVVAGNVLRTPLARFYQQNRRSLSAFPMADAVTERSVYIGNHATRIAWPTVREQVA